MATTRLSSKGQIIIPQDIREAHQWRAGVEFAVIDTKDGILLSPLKSFPQVSVQHVLGCTGYRGRKKSIKDMQQGLIKGAKKHK